MSTEETYILIALLLAFYITVKQPFLVASFIILFVIYIKYFAEKLEPLEKRGAQKGSVGKYKQFQATAVPGPITTDPQATDTDKKKSQREILAEIEASEPPPKEKFGKLLLTYQVPNMTDYYESMCGLTKRVRFRCCSSEELLSIEEEFMPKVKEIEVALCYLRQVLCSNSPQLIGKSATALLDAIAGNCDPKDQRLQECLVRLLRYTDQYLSKKPNVNVDAMMIALAETSSAVNDCPRPNTAGSNKPMQTPEETTPSPEPPKATISEMDDPNIDELLKQLNIRQVPKFSPEFPDLGGDSDDDASVTTEEKKEERAEKHGHKMCEEEVQKLPDGTEVRMKKTRTMNVSQSSKHVTISTRGGGAPATTRKFCDGSRKMDEDEEEENTDFFSRDPFERFRKRNTLMELEGTSSPPQSPSESTKTKTLERTSEVSQSVSARRERNGQVVGEQAASKLDTSLLQAKMTDTFKGEQLLDRKGEGSYEENTTIQRGLPSTDGAPVPPPKKHVVEYMQTFGNKDNTDDEYFRGSTLASYIQLNDNLRIQEEQFRKKLHFEFSAAGTSQLTPDFTKLADLLQANDFAAIKLPTKWTPDDDDDRRSIDWQDRKAIKYIQEILSCIDVGDYLVMRAKDEHSKPTEVRGGPRDALVVYSAQQNAPLLYQEAFLVTYRTFIPSNDLINKLIKRYLHMVDAPNHKYQSAARLSFSILVRVVDELTAIELDQSLVDSVTSFVYRLIKDGNLIFARILRKRLLDRIEDRMDRHLNPALSKISSPKKNSLFDFRSVDIAAQMTLIDAQLFQHIEPAELLWWAQEQDIQKSPNLVQFTENFNNVSFWVRSLVISHSTGKEREKYMLKFIKIMKHLRRLSNFNSYLAVLSALMSSPVSRLDWSASITNNLKEHSDIMDTSGSYKNYRQLLNKAAPPCVPYVGVVLQDLTFVHAGNPSKLPADRCNGKKNMINFLKHWHQYAILESVRKLKRWNYDVQRDEKVIAFFATFKNFMNEEETWQRSHDIKPPARRRL